ncbi:MAG: phosphate ABC transporter ATP-binding protein [Methanophagales archaeon ANME-1-THS]|nr:MAG: phosphate ABC transporter ATP-binding protein [Methanophagales archaeon ANME-1-THS]
MEKFKPHISVEKLNVFYGKHHVLKDITVKIPEKQITVIIGPSGCGKTTLLKSFNRLIDLVEGISVSGDVRVDGMDIYNGKIDVTNIRKKIGMLAQKPYPLPMSIYDNVAYGPRIHGILKRKELDRIVERYLKVAGLWDEVKDRLKSPASRLSAGQQQRLCLARTLAVEPEIILGDEPTSALDPVSAKRIEQEFIELKKDYTIVIVTHILRQAKRLADHVIFLYMGEVIEAGPAREIFEDPKEARTRAYIGGEIS